MHGEPETNPKWQGGLIINADLPADYLQTYLRILRDFSNNCDCDCDYEFLTVKSQSMASISRENFIKLCSSRLDYNDFRIKRPTNY